MATNYPGPYQVRIYYDVTPTTFDELTHVLQLNVDLETDPTPGDTFNSIDAMRRDSLTIALSAAVDSLVALMKPLFGTGDGTFTYAELWKYEALSFNASYISTYAINEVFTGATDSNRAEQSIYTFRTFEGGIMKVYLNETIHTPGPQLNYGALSTASAAFVDEFLDDQYGIWLARDTSYPFSFLRQSPGESEAIFKKRFRE